MKKQYKELIKLNKSNQREYARREKELKKYYDEINKTKRIVDFIDGFKKIKPSLLMNYGREGKYIYGQIFYNSSPHDNKKKRHRFMLGKMSDKYSEKKLREKCLELFYNKYIIKWFFESK